MQRQKLPGKATSVVDALRSGGWVHTAGGTGAYVAMHARLARFKRIDLDRIVFRSYDVLELPAVRDSTMLVPRDSASIALAAARRAFDKRLAMFVRACSVTRREIERLAERILTAIGDRSLSADALRAEIPESMIRDLGERGRKLGHTTTVPLALRLLQVWGRVLRVPEDQRINAKGYLYCRWPESVQLVDRRWSEEDLDNELARRFVDWAWPATAADFAWWADIPKRRSAAAFGGSHADQAASDGRGIALIPFRDNYLYLRRGLLSFVDVPSGLTLLDWNGKPVPVERLESLHTNAIIVDGELRGIWEWDPDAGEIAWRLFRREKPAVRSAVEEKVGALEAFIRDEIGDHRFYPFDTAKTRAPRIAFARL